jgi:hypothetical protein
MTRSAPALGAGLSSDTSPEGLNDASPTAKIYQAMVADLLAAERDRRATLAARGATILTASGTLVALVVALAAIVVGKDHVFVNHTAIVELCKALPFFVLSAVFALVVQTYGFAYQVINRKSLNKLADETDEMWNRSATFAVRDDVGQQVRTICTLRDGNDKMAMLIMVSLVFEIVAIALLSVAVGFELHARI